MRISQETINQIQNRIDLIEVVSDYVSLKKRGSNWMACCPFHHEKTPSFSVSPSKGIYKCFGCGRGGDAITFIMEIENASYPEALKQLAKKYGIEIEQDEDLSAEEIAQQNEKESILILHEFAKKYYQDLLWNSDAGKSIGLRYFKERGFKQNTMETFELGFSLPEWEAFSKAALKAGYTEQVLEKSGLGIPKDNNRFIDRFRDRVIFPIHNVSGKVIAFGARILKKDKKQAKYLNSPETPIYHKSQVVYGIYQAKKKIREEDRCYLVEGYTDVIALHQGGIENVVASSGTSLTKEQIRLIRRFTSNITILYDGDAAGIKASLRGMDLILEEGLFVKIAIFPDGEDPDSYIQKVGSSQFKSYIQDEAQDFISFKANLYREEAKNDPIKQAEMIKEMANSLASIPDASLRQAYTTQTFNLLQVPEWALIDETNKILRQKHKKASSQLPPKPADKPTTDAEVVQEEIEENLSQDPLSFRIERDIIRLLMNYASEKLDDGQTVGQYILDNLQNIIIQNPLYREIIETFRTQAKKGKIIQADYFIKGQDLEAKKLAIDLLDRHTSTSHIKDRISKGWQEHHIYTPDENSKPTILISVIQRNIDHMSMFQIKRLQEENRQNILNAKTDEEIDKYMRIEMKLKAHEKEIAARNGNVIWKV